MGYYTSYSLNIFNFNNGRIENISEEDFKSFLIFQLRKISEGAKTSLNEFGETENSCKWYDWKEDLKELSNRYQGFLFELIGVGEETEDIWKAFFLNGKCQLCPGRIVFEEFDIAKMKE